MKTTILALTAGLFASGVAFAASETFTLVDQDGSGTLTMDEVKAAMPDATAETFAIADANGDGALDEGEFTSAVEAGVLPTQG